MGVGERDEWVEWEVGGRTVPTLVFMSTGGGAASSNGAPPTGGAANTSTGLLKKLEVSATEVPEDCPNKSFAAAVSTGAPAVKSLRAVEFTVGDANPGSVEPLGD